MCNAPSSPAHGPAQGSSAPGLAGHCNGRPSLRPNVLCLTREGRCEADVWDQHVIGLCCILFLELLAKHPLLTAPTPLRAGST
jgi:hypothetical protein